MPSQINVQITGRIQNVVFYKRGDKYYARSVSGKVKQTKATKKRATEFGKSIQYGQMSEAATAFGYSLSGRQ